MSEIKVFETAPLIEAKSSPGAKGTRWRARIIAGNVQGSSGYYSEAMLRRCAGVFAAGTQVFVDHPGLDERHDRPERSVRDLAGKLTSTAVYENDGLYADIEVYPHFAPIIEAMAGDIGMSIRAGGWAEASEDPNIPGPIITELSYAESVDFVTVPGAGGRLISLLESARKGKELVEARNVGGWLEARLHEQFTCIADDMYGEGYLTREERISLSSGIGDALKAFVERVNSDAPQLFARDLWVAPGPAPTAATETGSSTQKEAPVAENNEGAPPVGGASEVETDKPVDATEAAAAARVNDLEKRIKDMSGELAQARENARLSQSDSFKLAESRKENSDLRETVVRLQSIESARAAVAESFGKSNLPPVALGKVTAAVIGLDGMTLPLAEGALDRAKLKESIDAAILEESQYVAQISAGNGAGLVRGMGGSAQPAPVNEAAAKSALEATFKALGNMSDDEAARAAEGR